MKETSHVRHMRRELQDATALRTIVRSFEALRQPGLSADSFAGGVVETLLAGWEAGTLTDRIRLPASDPLVPRAEKCGFTWGRGQRHRNRAPV